MSPRVLRRAGGRHRESIGMRQKKLVFPPQSTVILAPERNPQVNQTIKFGPLCDSAMNAPMLGAEPRRIAIQSLPGLVGLRSFSLTTRAMAAEGWGQDAFSIRNAHDEPHLERNPPFSLISFILSDRVPATPCSSGPRSVVPAFCRPLRAPVSLEFPMSRSYKGDVTPAECWSALDSDEPAFLVDVRTSAEWNFVGFPLAPAGRPQPLFAEWQTYPSMSIDGSFAPRVAEAIKASAAARPRPSSSCAARAPGPWRAPAR